MNSLIKCSRANLHRIFLFANVQQATPVCCRHVQQRHMSDRVVDPEDMTPPIPEYQDRGPDEPVEQKKARLLYQSRKRGMLENGLLLSTFASKYLEKLTNDQLTHYDSLINKPTNDWEIYYWAIGNKPTPTEYDTDVMDLLKEHAQNKDRDLRIRQPDLYA